MAAAVICCGVLIGFASTIGAQSAEPLYHGALTIRPANGSIDPNTGASAVKVKRWTFVLTPDSNGMQPDAEPVVVGVGETERLVIPAGSLTASKNGRVFKYKNPTAERGIRAFRIWRGRDATLWQIRVHLVGIDLSRLTISYPDCTPMAIIVGDDDGFSGITLDRPDGFNGKRLRISGFCDSVGDWPWL